jgi:hypothetical protein
MAQASPSWEDLRARCAAGGVSFAFVIPVYNHARNVAQVAAAAATGRQPVSRACACSGTR